MELTLVGLQYSGKTTFVNVIAVSKIVGFYPTHFTSVSNIEQSDGSFCVVCKATIGLKRGSLYSYVSNK